MESDYIIVKIPANVSEEARGAILLQLQQDFVNQSLEESYKAVANYTFLFSSFATFVSGLVISGRALLATVAGTAVIFGATKFFDKEHYPPAEISHQQKNFTSKNWQLFREWRKCEHALLQIDRVFDLGREDEVRLHKLSLDTCPPDLRSSFKKNAFITGLKVSPLGYVYRDIRCLISEGRNRANSSLDT